MDILFSENIDAILSTGYWLGEIGVKNWALERTSALRAIDDLEAAKIGLLGGDVYYLVGGKLLPPRDSWYCNLSSGEDEQSFAIRSAAQAREYITRYPELPDLLGFAIVPRVQ